MKAEEIERYLRIYQSSSPSYVFLAGIENCIFHMDREGRQRMERFYENVCRMRTKPEKDAPPVPAGPGVDWKLRCV